MKEFLSRTGVAFEVRNVDEDDSAYHELVEKGYRTIPVTFIGDKAVRGYDERGLKAALAALSSPDR